MYSRFIKKILPGCDKKVGIFLFLVIFLAILLRANNLFTYSTWWADDGGGHIGYVQEILDYSRLPSQGQNYLAWHEPGYYLIMAGWTKIGMIFGFENNYLLDWQESFNLVLFLCLSLVVWQISFLYSQNRWISLLNVFLISFLFVSVKLSSYLNNELSAQIAILALLFLFWKFRLAEPEKERKIVWWSILAAFALFLKTTVWLVIGAAIVLWIEQVIMTRKKHCLKYIAVSCFVVLCLYAPWMAYKQIEFGDVLSLNVFEQGHKQSIAKSDAWAYLFHTNPYVFLNFPFWYYGKHSFVSTLIADAFSDYYNLFSDPNLENIMPLQEKILVGNGRYATIEDWRSNILMNQTGFTISLIWLIGFFGRAWNGMREKAVNWYQELVIILVGSGLLALVYNNLRYPYLERGVLKAGFIFFVFPLVSVIAYTWWWQKTERKWLWFLVCFLPLIVYLIVAWPVLQVL